MNDNTWLALQAHLDQAVATLPARHGRKQAMREELLAHLLGLYEEEFTRLHDEKSAFDEAVRRFGGIHNLRNELTACVPSWERIVYVILGKKEKLMWRLFIILGALAFLVGLGFIMPALQQLLFQEVLPLAVVLLIFGTLVTLGGIWSVVHGIKQFRLGSS